MKNRRSNLKTRLRTQIWLISWICILNLFVHGCSLTVPAVPDAISHFSPEDSEHAPASEVWRALAHAIESGTIGTTTRLAQYVAVLARNGELTEQDVVAFDGAFPRIATDSRALTDADVKALIELGRKSKG